MNTSPNKSGSISSGENTSFWIASTSPLQFSELDQDLETDVLVIGAGIAGLTTAYCLLKAGRKVVVVEDGLIGSGESGRTTAHLTCALDDRFYEIEAAFGEQGSKMAAESHAYAIDWIEKTVRDHQIDCHFKRVDGYLFIHPSDNKDNLRKELDATRKAGLATQWLDQVPGLSAESGPCLLFPRQAQFHMMRYLQGLAHEVRRMGGQIYTETHATHIDRNGAECNGKQVKAAQVVVATNTPVNNLVAIHTKQFPYRTYVIGARVPKGQLPHCLWWDTGNQDSKWITAPYHYVRLESLDTEYDLLIAGGEDHKTGQADAEHIPEQERFNALIDWTRKRFPMMKEVVYQWSGQVMEPVDYMAFIGKNPGDDNVYIITGDSGNGLTHGTLGGIIVSDLIQGIDNRWAEFYSPKRSPLRVPGAYFSEVLNMAAQYGDFLSSTDLSDASSLPPDEGAILTKGLKRIAIYKDANNQVHAYSALCPHLGCVLQWNGEEKSFDCPCHGSRFTKEGVVVNGPALTNLKPIPIKEDETRQPS